MKLRFSLLEIFLFETVVWLCLWLISDYVAALLTLILGAIVSAVLIIALISEVIERSRVPKIYFQVMAISILSTALTAVIYIMLSGGNLDFLTR